MDSANGFCLPRKCPLLIIKSRKTCFFLLFFITSSLLSNSRRKKGTAEHGLGQQERDGPGIELAPSPLQGQMGRQQLPCPSALRNRKPSQNFKLTSELHYQLAALPDPCQCLLYMKVVEASRACEQERVFVFGRAPPGLATCHPLGGSGEKENEYNREVGHPRLLGPSPVLAGRILCMVELIRGLVLSQCCFIPRHTVQSSKISCGLNLQAAFRQPFSQTSPVFFSHSRTTSSFGHLIAGRPFQQRAGRGKGKAIYYSICPEQFPEQVKTNFLDY